VALDVYADMEQCFERGWSDGLPVVPPYGSLVDRMLAAMGWEAAEVVGEIAAQNIEIRAEHLAATAVMAGCRFEYGPLLRALSELLVAPEFNLSGVEVTTGGVAALVIVSGPVVAELGFEHAANALGATAGPTPPSAATPRWCATSADGAAAPSSRTAPSATPAG
jgi:hypothetical protein